MEKGLPGGQKVSLAGPGPRHWEETACCLEAEDWQILGTVALACPAPPRPLCLILHVLVLEFTNEEMADPEETIDTHIENAGILWAMPALMEGTYCETQKPYMFILCSTEGGSASFGERLL